MAAVLLACCPLVEAGMGRDVNGWTTFTPSADTRIIYVSSSGGNDATAQWYAPGNGAIGADPFNPTGAILPYATIAAASAVSRNGYPDWVLLKRGDQFFEKLATRNGRAADERSLYGAYGGATSRPLLKIASGVGWSCSGIKHAAIVSMDMYAYKRDPASPDYAGAAGATMIDIGVSSSGGTNVVSLLIEDCLLRFGSANIDFENRNGSTCLDVLIRRNVLLDSYSTNSHSQGMFAYGASCVLEENIFDHNGWLVQGGGNNDQARGAATVFNHNTYYSHCHDVTFRGNTFIRASSIGNKWTADSDERASNLSMIDNLYVDGEVGISIGGNNPGTYRFPNAAIISNVFTDIGLSRPTGRTLAWYVGVQDWDGGVIAGNLLLHQTNTVVKNTHGISFSGTGSRNVSVRDNVIHNLLGRYGVTLTDSAGNENIVFSGNKVQFPGLDTRLVVSEEPLPVMTFRDSTYYSDCGAGTWFLYDDGDMGFASWQTAAREQSAVAHKLVFPDPARTVQTYMTSIGGAGTYAAFIAAVRGQSKTNWRPELTAHAMNEYFRAGFASLDVATETLPQAVLGQAYTAALTAANATGAVSWSVLAGSMPSGLVLNADGVISGTPQVLDVAGSHAFTVLARDAINANPKTLVILVVPEPCELALCAAVLLMVRRR
ncbi:hypothetical protein GX586_01210 [bacterium]|nr:hypothetical protein [bacterium]